MLSRIGFTTETQRAQGHEKESRSGMIGYVLMLLASMAVLSAFLFRSVIFIGINTHSVELWLLVRMAGLVTFSIGALTAFRSVN